MAKDYHKGVRVQVYIPEDLNEKLNVESKRYEMSKTKIVTDALYSYIGDHARDSIHKVNTQK